MDTRVSYRERNDADFECFIVFALTAFACSLFCLPRAGSCSLVWVEQPHVLSPHSSWHSKHGWESLGSFVCIPRWRQKWRSFQIIPQPLSTTLLFKTVLLFLYAAVCKFLEAGASSEPFPVQFWAVMTTREHGRASVAWESQCSVHMPLSGGNCLPMPWLIPPWFFHDMKWECSGQLACLAACAPSQGEFVLGASWGQITAACLPRPSFSGSRASALTEHPPSHKPTCFFLPLSSCRKGNLNPGQPHDQMELSPTKTHGSSTGGKGEAWGGRGRNIPSQEFLNSVWHPKPLVSLSCYWQDLGKDLRFCSLFLANQMQGACI